METWQMLRRCIIANIRRRRRHIAGGSKHSFNFLDEELGKFVGVDVSWGWRRPLSRDNTDETNRQSYRGHTIFYLNGPLL